MLVTDEQDLGGLNNIEVAPYLRIVPNGFASSENDVVLTATLLLTPVKVEEGVEGKHAGLLTWPKCASDILSNLSGLTVALEHCDSSGAGEKVTAKAVRHPSPGFPGLLARNIDDLTDLWQDSLVPEKINEETYARQDVWNDLADQIRSVLDGSRVQPSDNLKNQEPYKDPDYYNPTVGKQGQFTEPPASGKRVCDTIISGGQADAALILEMQRAKELTETIADFGAFNKRLPDTKPPVEVPNDPDVLPEPPTETDPVARVVHYAEGIPFLVGSEPFSDAVEAWETRVIKAALGTMDDDIAFARVTYGEVLTDARKKSVEKAITNQKGKRHKALYDALKGQREQSSKAYNAAAKALLEQEPTIVCDFASIDPTRASLGAEKLTNARNATEYASWAQHVDETPNELSSSERAERLTTEAKSRTGQAYFGIDGNPGLARVFGLAMDVHIVFDASDKGKIDGMLYATLSTSLTTYDAPEGLPDIKTLLKLDKAGSALGSRDHGWPVSMAEYLIWKKAVSEGKEPNFLAHCIPQFEGVMVMGGLPDTSCETGKCRAMPRFDIATIDVGAAIEAERAWLQAIEEAEDTDFDLIKNRSRAQELKALLAIGPDYQSNGLTLLNRSAAGDALRKLAAVAGKLGAAAVCATCDSDGRQCVIHDAEDLTNGHRLLIGTPDANWKTEWRSLMARSYTYGKDGRGGELVEELLTAAVGPAGETARATLEAAMQAVPARDLKSDRTGGTADSVETMVDETFGQWDGTPGGVACSQVYEAQNKDVPDSNCFGRVISVPKSRDQDKLVPLRNGRPYRFAVQAVFAGGRGIDIERDMPMSSGSGNDVRARLFYPSLGQVDGKTNAEPYQRALRHARIGAPTVLLPEGHARLRDQDNAPMGYESVGKMIIRTMRHGSVAEVSKRDLNRARPEVSQRIVLVPNVPQSAAGRHFKEQSRIGVFDGSNVDGPPKGTLENVLYSIRRGSGFPVVKTETTPGIDGKPFNVERSRDVVFPRPEAIGPNDEMANAVYVGRGSTVDTTYYPDPAADQLVIRLRRSGGDRAAGKVLDKDPLAIPVATQSYPETSRVILTMSKQEEYTRSKDELATHETVLENRGRKLFRAKRRGNIVGIFNDSHWGHEVALHTRPGDHFQVEMWYVPSAWRLAHDFAVVQSTIQYFCNLGGAEGDCSLETLRAGISASGLTMHQQELMLACLEGINEDDAGKRYIGPGGDVLPGTEVTRIFGKVIHQHMLVHPIHEVAGVRKIEAIHAVNLADDAPDVAALDPTADPFPDPGCIINEENEGPLPIRAIRPVNAEVAVPEASFSDEIAIANGSNFIALKGQVRVDLEQIDALEIVARTISPNAAVFDDPTRGRSLAHRLAGTWPNDLGADGDTADPRRARDIFGFSLARDGRVKLPEGEIVLLKIENLQPPQTGSPVVDLNLDNYFLNKGNDALVSHRHAFPDPHARRMMLRINGLARSAEMLATAARKITDEDPWYRGTGIVYEEGELVPSEPVPKMNLANFSETVEVILPASVRPAIPDAHAPVPVMENETQQYLEDGGEVVFEFVRRARTRIPLGRGWFSSGVDERLGLVLWPPSQVLADHSDLATNRVTLREEPTCEVREKPLGSAVCGSGVLGDEAAPPPIDRVVPLPHFEDEDLGPGGKFVTRRGMDPVRLDQNPDTTDTQVFLSKETFPDLWRDISDPNVAEFVPYAEMPLSDMGDQAADFAKPPADEEETEELPEDPVPPMPVALVTYSPRFDPEREEWYVDVLMTPGERAESMVRFGLVRYQPHTRKDLRCSRPVVQWAQPLPERRVKIKHMPRQRLLQVVMEGPIAKGRKRETDFEVPGTADRDAPIMRLTMFREGTAPDGTATRMTIDLSGERAGNEDNALPNAPMSERLELKPVVTEGNGVWSAIINLSNIGVTELENIRLSVDEIEYFLPASFTEPEEPLDQEAVRAIPETIWEEAGARFSAVLDLKEVSLELVD